MRLSCLVLLISLTAAPLMAAETDKPRLLVLVVFDQMRGDYMERWQQIYVEGGFERMKKNGAWFNNCHYPYAITQTGPGHASMLTGCAPDQHGIVMNEWYDRKTSERVNCSESGRYQRVPPLPKTIPTEELKVPVKTEPKTGEAASPKGKLAGTPEWMLAPTVGDALKEATGGKAKVVGLSFKDRSALLPLGRGADAVYWLDSIDGMIVTSSFYRDSVHPWVAQFNKERVADRWFEKEWKHLLPDLDYVPHSGPDQVTGEGKGIKQGVTFPHLIDGGLKKPNKSYYEALFGSPFGNEFLFELVKRAIPAEKLGQDDVPDLLVVSFSSNDAVGHIWGPDSQEVLDVTLRSDRMMVEFLQFLDKEVGPGKYMLAMTADHGICPIPEVSAAKGINAKRVPIRKILTAAEDHLRKVFDKKPADPKDKTRWIESQQGSWSYLNYRLIESRKLKVEDVAKELAAFLRKQDGIERALTREDMKQDFPASDPIGQRVKKSYHPDRCGDVAYVLQPYCLTDGLLTGTSHGGPHPYDTHVPLLFFGPGIKPGTRTEAVTPQTIASVFSQAIGIKPPKMAVYPVPEGLFSSK